MIKDIYSWKSCHGKTEMMYHSTVLSLSSEELHESWGAHSIKLWVSWRKLQCKKKQGHSLGKSHFWSYGFLSVLFSFSCFLEKKSGVREGLDPGISTFTNPFILTLIQLRDPLNLKDITFKIIFIKNINKHDYLLYWFIFNEHIHKYVVNMYLVLLSFFSKLFFMDQ